MKTHKHAWMTWLSIVAVILTILTLFVVQPSYRPGVMAGYAICAQFYRDGSHILLVSANLSGRVGGSSVYLWQAKAIDDWETGREVPVGTDNNLYFVGNMDPKLGDIVDIPPLQTRFGTVTKAITGIHPVVRDYEYMEDWCPGLRATLTRRAVATGTFTPTATRTPTPTPTATPSPPKLEMNCELKSFGEPTVFRSNYINFSITNNGGTTFQPPQGGKYTIKLTLKRANGETLDELKYVTFNPLSLAPLGTLAPGQSQYLQITDVFFFHDVTDGQIELSFAPDPPSGLPTTTCTIKAINIKPNPDNCSTYVAKTFVVAVNALFPETLGVDAAAQAFLNLPEMLLKWQACGADISCYGEALGEYLLSVSEAVPAKLISLLADITSFMQEKNPACSSWAEYLNATVQEFIRNKVPINSASVQSPAYILVTNSSGQRAGFSDDGSLVQEIPGARAVTVDEAKLVLFPADNAVTIRVKGTASGTMKLNLELMNRNGDPMPASYPNIPLSATTVGTIDTTDSRLLLSLDDNGDGVVDRIVHPAEAGGASTIETPTPLPSATATILPTQAPSNQTILTPNSMIMVIFVLLLVVILLIGLLGYVLGKRR